MAGKSNNGHWAVGPHAVQAVLTHQPELATCLFYVQEIPHGLYNELKALGIATQSIDKKRLSDLTGHPNHQGIAMQTKPIPLLNHKGFVEEMAYQLEQLPSKKTPVILALDGVQDPHNLGACLRTAEALGVLGVVWAKHNAAPLTSTAQKIATGAQYALTLGQVSNLSQTLQALKDAGFWAVGADMAGQSIRTADLPEKLVLVMGAEGEGISKRVSSQCDYHVQIPMRGSTQSLNVSVATGILLHELTS